ncbi:MFS-type transporter SLC18B1-like [Mya arenaria]|uniref:MFS-type transporter SLC18B1-like n=1 Tax=Mya arenaria TaxID=6604 RepID=UPI0022E5F08D|nr:MFS-type transporter SLC18B1-like [Mya arenaria]XP_052763727.1 MFS-type transporter SLC18B1-like [Mya arenaria]XP_052763728.1 MFS-type transporter SLC18B1-like [Mya arenaria]XP_052763729.1 MFS-type transporter SLC18B1-like [Mya arenaria]XP_052763730.1 MFS-type transporter SLC18B1-like [Mya arenaria]
MSDRRVSERTPLLGQQVDHREEHEKEKDTVPASPLEEKEFSFKSVDRRRKFILLSMALVNFCATCCFSLLAPFFPLEAKRKGASQTIVGMIFGCFELVIVITSPIFGSYISKIGCKFMYVAGIFVCGTCAILFGTLDMSPDGDMFIVMCFLCRSVEALGCSALVTALFAVLAHEFPDNVITVMGLLETSSGLGMMVGPPIGGALYELGGYGLPFFVMGSLVIVCGSVTAYAMPPISDGSKLYEGSIFALLKSPLVIITFINISAGSVALGFMDPTLAPHLDQFNLKTWLIGFMFLIAPAIYAITAPCWGYIGDKKGIVRLMIAGGNLVAVIPWLLMGPSPLISFVPNALYMNIIALSVIGLALGCALIPTFKALLMGANSLGMENNLDTYGKCSGFFNSSFSMGAFLGATIGGFLVDKVGFPWASTGVSGFLGLGGLLMIAYMCMVPNMPRLPEKPDAIEQTVIVVKNANNAENTPVKDTITDSNVQYV